jgi:hypothetical protein
MTTHPTTRCVDCGIDAMPDTPPGSRDWQRYMVHDHVWQAAGMDPNGGWLCIPRLEARLTRPLTGADFPELPLNHPIWKYSADDTRTTRTLKLQAALMNETPLWESLIDYDRRTRRVGGPGGNARLTPPPAPPASACVCWARKSPSRRS